MAGFAFLSLHQRKHHSTMKDITVIKKLATLQLAAGVRPIMSYSKCWVLVRGAPDIRLDNKNPIQCTPEAFGYARKKQEYPKSLNSKVILK